MYAVVWIKMKNKLKSIAFESGQSGLPPWLTNTRTIKVSAKNMLILI